MISERLRWPIEGSVLVEPPRIDQPYLDVRTVIRKYHTASDTISDNRALVYKV